MVIRLRRAVFISAIALNIVTGGCSPEDGKPSSAEQSVQSHTIQVAAPPYVNWLPVRTAAELTDYEARGIVGLLDGPIDADGWSSMVRRLFSNPSNREFISAPALTIEQIDGALLTGGQGSAQYYMHLRQELPGQYARIVGALMGGAALSASTRDILNAAWIIDTTAQVHKGMHISDEVAGRLNTLTVSVLEQRGRIDAWSCIQHPLTSESFDAQQAWLAEPVDQVIEYAEILYWAESFAESGLANSIDPELVIFDIVEGLVAEGFHPSYAFFTPTQPSDIDDDFCEFYIALYHNLSQRSLKSQGAVFRAGNRQIFEGRGWR